MLRWCIVAKQIDIKMPFGMEVGLGPCHIVLGGDPALPQKGHSPSPQFSALVCAVLYCVHSDNQSCPAWARGTLFPPSSFALFYFSLSFLICFTYFLLFSIPSLSTRIVPLRFQAGGRRKRPNLGLVCLFILCYLYFLVFLLYLVLV